MTTVQTAYVRENQEASVICANCGAHKLVQAVPFRSGYLHASARCCCGFTFKVAFERRRSYRKKVSLGGHYLLKNESRDFGEIVVEDVSRSGIGFRSCFCHNLKVNDVGRLTFVLDNAGSTKITKNAVVRNVTGRFVGAEFCDNEYDKTLGFYLLR